MGYLLAERIRQQIPPEELKQIDAVVPIPETSYISAYAVSKHLKIPYCQGFVKNRYIFRTFIMPNQKARQKGVRAKLNAIPIEFQGKNVLLVDDSIVRGTTCREIILMAREAGAKKVHFASCAPPITHAHIYGIDLASTSELIAHERTEKDIAKQIDADTVVYQTLEDLEESCAAISPRDPKTQKFEVGVFCGKYVTPVEDAYFEHLERMRGDAKKMKVLESAREAVRQGAAGAEEVRMAANGVEVDHHGNVVPADGGDDDLKSAASTLVNSEKPSRPSSTPAQNGGHRESQDISLHNLNDER